MLRRTIHSLVEGLAGIPPREFSRPRVLQEIGAAIIDPESLRPYLYYCRTHYTRNLIHTCELFDILAIGWEPGQSSAIHNHRGQECWMGVPIGQLEVRNYRLLERDERARTCRLLPSIRYRMDPGHPAAIDPAEPIHSVHNLAEFGARSVSLHVYSLPFRSCEVYLPEEGRYLEMPLEFTSRFGALCPGESAEPAHPAGAAAGDGAAR